MCGMKAASCLKMTGANCPGQLAAMGSNIHPVQPWEPAQQVLGFYFFKKHVGLNSHP